MNFCFKVLTFLHLYSSEAYVVKTDKIIEAAFKPDSRIPDYVKMVQVLPEFISELRLAPKAKVLEWVQDEPKLGGIYGQLQEIKEIRKRSETKK